MSGFNVFGGFTKAVIHEKEKTQRCGAAINICGKEKFAHLCHKRGRAGLLIIVSYQQDLLSGTKNMSN